MTRAILCCVWLGAAGACSTDAESDDDKPEDTDDTEDTDHGTPSAIDGTWSGTCTGDVVLTHGGTTSTYTQTLDLVGELEGSIDGNTVVLDFIGYTSTTTLPQTDDIPAWLELVLDGDTLDGDLVFVDGSSGRHPVPCAFVRVAGRRSGA